MLINLRSGPLLVLLLQYFTVTRTVTQSAVIYLRHAKLLVFVQYLNLNLIKTYNS